MIATEHIYYLPLTKSVILSCGTPALCLVLIAVRVLVIGERLFITEVRMGIAYITNTVFLSL
jgi:hypothetical protein